jgi:hypothetical protein
MHIYQICHYDIRAHIILTQDDEKAAINFKINFILLYTILKMFRLQPPFSICGSHLPQMFLHAF